MLSRRELAAGSALLISGGLPSFAQPAPADGIRVLQVRSAPPFADGAPALGYDGTVPGPPLRVRRGEELRVRVVNHSTEATTVHWHGVRVPNAMDGVAGLTQPAITPSGSFDYRFRAPDAGTFWYHAETSSQVERGLVGALIVEESRAVDVDRDIALVLTGAGATPIRVNGSMQPDVAVAPGERVRLRLVNATSARGMSLKIEGHGLWVMAIDGQPAEPFVARDSRIGLAPGSRIDLFVDMLRDAGSTAALVATGTNEQVVARLVYAESPRAAARREPSPLAANPLPSQVDLRSAQRVELALAARPSALGSVPLFTVRRGRSVTLGIRKDAGPPHVLHLHGHHMRHLDRLDDGWKPYWLDTLVIGDQVERIAFVADNPGKWLIESRVLDRPDSTAAVWFAVT